MSKRRVLVVDDSPFMRAVLCRAIRQDARFEVVGEAGGGEEALRQLIALQPDVITMDVAMPGMDGVEATRRIMATRPTPVLIVSAHARRGGPELVSALAAGAIDFVTKPDGEVSATLGSARDELLERLAAVAEVSFSNAPRDVRITSLSPLSGLSQPPRSVTVPPVRMSSLPPRGTSVRPPRLEGLRVIVIASSTGGPAALHRVLPYLRLTTRATLLIVQHMPEGLTRALADQLAEKAPFPVREAVHDEPLTAGVALVAPGDRHLVVERGRVVLTDEPAEHGVRPAADVTLRSVARHYGARAVAVVLTGMGRDGALGAAAVKAAGGATIAQDKNSSVVWGMPRAAIELGIVDSVVSVDHIAPTINACLA